MCDTPIRRDEYPIYNTRFRSKVLVSNCKKNYVKQKIVKNNLKERKNKIIASLSSSSDLDISATIDENKHKESDCETLEVQDNEEATDLTSPFQHIDLLRLNSTDIQKESDNRYTPIALQHPLRAVSSTPNQEIPSNNVLTCNASTQTDFTLSVREFDELNDDLKSFCVEAPHEQSAYLLACNENSSPNISSNTTPPSRKLSAINSTNYENTPRRIKPHSVRRLSLRSKTMICSAIGKTRDRHNVLARFNSMEEKRIFSNTFSLLPQPVISPQCEGRKLHNPFETNLQERLGKSIFSPDVFTNVVSPSEESESIRWTIEDISSINPVPIEEGLNFPSDDEDPDRESQVQLEIDRYFSETHVVLSPYDVPTLSNCSGKGDKVSAKAVSSTPGRAFIKVSSELNHAKTQTILSLPKELPEVLEESLRSYFKIFETDDLNLSASNLRRKLFFHSEDEPPSPVRFERNSSPDLWGTEHSPSSVVKKRHFTPSSFQGQISSPEVSPVGCESVRLDNDTMLSCKKTLHLHFQGDSHWRGVQDSSIMGPVVNSTVIANNADTQNEVIEDCSSTVSSVLPSSQDTGYNTEESWHQHNLMLTSPSKLPISIMASTPTHKV